MRRILLVFLALIAAVTAVWSFWPAEPPVNYDVEHQPFPLIPPGTIIGAEPPEGWTHLLIKSHPRPGLGDVHRIPSAALPLTQLLFTATVARVEAQPGVRNRYRLAEAALGLGTRIGDRDVIISPDTQARLGAGFGVFARFVLARAYAKLQEAVRVARSDTMILMDATAFMVRAGKHRPIVLRHALLIDPATGHIDTLAWCIDIDGQKRLASRASPIEWFPPSLIEAPLLHVDGSEFNALGLPGDSAFAMPGMPAGEKQLAVPPELDELCERPSFSSAEAARLERGLRQLLRPDQR